MKRVKKFGDFGAEKIWRVELKGSGFCSFGCFWESEKTDVWKKFLSERIFSRAAFKCSFFQLLMVMKFDYDIVLVLGLFW